MRAWRACVHVNWEREPEGMREWWLGGFEWGADGWGAGGGREQAIRECGDHLLPEEPEEAVGSGAHPHHRQRLAADVGSDPQGDVMNTNYTRCSCDM